MGCIISGLKVAISPLYLAAFNFTLPVKPKNTFGVKVYLWPLFSDWMDLKKIRLHSTAQFSISLVQQLLQ